MKILFGLFFISIGFLSCGIHHDKQNDCNYKVKKALKDASKYITMNKKTKVYTLHYAKLPEIEKSRFEKLRDSIEYVSALSIKRLKLQWKLFFLRSRQKTQA